MRGQIGIGRWLWIAAVASLIPQLATAQVRINELQAKNRFTTADDDDDASDWVELLNVGSESVDLFRYGLSDDPDDPAKWTFPPVELAAGERVLVWCSDKNRYVPSDEAIESEDSTIPFTPRLIDEVAAWSYLIGAPDELPPPLGWNQPGYDASAWPVGRGPIGFGFGGAGLGTELPRSIGAVFLRHEFKVDHPAQVPNLILDAVFDDGFVVWLNGVRVLDVGYPGDEPDPTFASCAQAAPEKRRGRWNLSEKLTLLRKENVLAVALLNAGPTSGDLQLALRLGTVAPALHASFALSRSGETIVLTDPSGKVVDTVRFPEQDEDRTYGRYPDGTGEFHYMALPTPEAPNDHRIASERIPSEIVFAPPPGAYPKPIEITLESHVPFSEYEIRYTTDGEEPTSSSPVYEGPIPIKSETSLRARGFLGGEPVTQTATASYFGMTPTTGDLALPVMSITLSPSEYQFVHNSADARGKTAERAAHMEIFDERGRRKVDLGMGMRIHGGAGRGGDFNTKKAYRVYFRGEYGEKKLKYPLIPSTPVDEFDKLVLRANFNDAFRTGNEAAFIRDQVVRDLYQQMGAIVSHGTWCNLIVNGRYRGIYNVVERMDKDFFQAYFPAEGKDWYVVKTGNDVLDGGSEAAQAWAELRRFFATSDLRDESLFARAKELIDIDSFTTYMILNVWAQNHDWPHNNWYAARPARPGGRWMFLCWDAEFGLGRVPGGFNADTFSHVFSRGDSAFAVILQALLKNSGYQEHFLEELDRHLEGALSPGNVVAVIDRQARLIADDVPEEAALTGRTPDVWRENVDSMRTFAHGRGAAIRSFILRSNRFTFPQVTSATPRILSPNGEVEIILRGVRFTESTEVRFNGVPSPRVTFVDSRRLDVVVPYDERLAGMPVVTAVDPEMGTSSSRDILRVEIPAAARGRGRALLDPAIVPPVGKKRLEAARVPGGLRSELRDARPRSGPSATDAAGDAGDERANEDSPSALVPSQPRSPDSSHLDMPTEVPSHRSWPSSSRADAPRFRRGDVDGSGRVDLSDALHTLRWMTGEACAAECPDAMDADDSGRIDLADPILVLRWLFDGSRPPADPFVACGPDPTHDGLDCEETRNRCP